MCLHTTMTCVAYEISHNHMFFDSFLHWIFPFDVSLSNSLLFQLETEIFSGQIVERSEC